MNGIPLSALRAAFEEGHKLARKNPKQTEAEAWESSAVCAGIDANARGHITVNLLRGNPGPEFFNDINCPADTLPEAVHEVAKLAFKQGLEAAPFLPQKVSFDPWLVSNIRVTIVDAGLKYGVVIDTAKVEERG